ncbi:MAG: type III-A CRISPR-associated protein Cas10/Csm1, partial [Chitinispirillaceae bacterium]|nr:type III-A CRISPR-associated protein Cas10/Csm1 [Chitinispirillaceae bacterium]
MTESEKILIYSALLHDIGKFWQRGDVNNSKENHQTLSSTFVNNLFNKNHRLSNIIRNHQEKDLKISIEKGEIRDEDKIIAQIICEADNLASGERDPDDTITHQQPLESIFSKISYKKEIIPQLYFQDICELFHKEYLFPISSKDYKLETLEIKYKEWWESFKRDIEKIDDKLETLIFILKKYLWCIPSSSYHTKSDVSLFEHLKITTAIAISMYRFLLEKYNGDISKFSEIEDRKEERYQLVLGDITGIQSYIYNIGYKGAAKALKGRSFFLQQLLDNIAYYILDKKLDLPITNLIYSSGGKFYLFVPNTLKVNLLLKEIQKEIEMLLLKEYNGALGIVIGKIPLSGKE